jgi:hypothetical protein
MFKNNSPSFSFDSLSVDSSFDTCMGKDLFFLWKSLETTVSFKYFFFSLSIPSIIRKKSLYGSDRTKHEDHVFPSQSKVIFLNLFDRVIFLG